MNWYVYCSGLYIKCFRRYADAYAFKRDWMRKFPNDFVTIRHKGF